MKAFALVLLLSVNALAAPQGEVTDSEEKVETRQVKPVVPEARQLLAQEVFLQDTPQFGARINPQYYYQQPQQYYQQPQQYYQQPQQYYQQPQQYYPGQQLSYIRGNPAQAYYSGERYYTGAPQYVQPQLVKNTVVKAVPSVYSVPQVSYTGAAQPVYRPVVKSAAPVAVPAAPVVVKSAAPVLAPVAPVTPVLKQALPEPVHTILRSSHDDNFDGSFSYGYETDHGIVVESSGFLKNAGTEDETQVIQGSYTWYTAEGVPITTTYIADENGFQVQGDHLPVPPALPEAIAKSIEYQRSLPPVEEHPAQVKIAKA